MPGGSARHDPSLTTVYVHIGFLDTGQRRRIDTMRRGVSSILMTAAVLAATACSGGGAGGPTTVDALASKLGCSELQVVTDDSQRALDATGDGSCEFAGERVQLLTFDTDSALDRAIRIGKEFGQIFVIGEGWTARVASAATAQSVRAKLGGVVR